MSNRQSNFIPGENRAASELIAAQFEHEWYRETTAHGAKASSKTGPQHQSSGHEFKSFGTLNSSATGRHSNANLQPPLRLDQSRCRMGESGETIPRCPKSQRNRMFAPEVYRSSTHEVGRIGSFNCHTCVTRLNSFQISNLHSQNIFTPEQADLFRMNLGAEAGEVRPSDGCHGELKQTPT